MNQGKIYNIHCLTTNQVYIGSTIKDNIDVRVKEHLSYYKSYLNGKKTTYYSSYNVLKHNNYIVEIIEVLPFIHKRELHFREKYFIENTENVVNLRVPNRRSILI